MAAAPPDLESITRRNPNNPILKSAARVCERARHVKVDQKAVADLANSLGKSGFDHMHKHWSENAPVTSRKYFSDLSLQNKITFLLVFHTIGFCYWGEPRWTISIPPNPTKYNGAMGLWISLASEPGFLDLSALSSCTQAKFKQMLAGFKSENIDSLSLLPERFEYAGKLAAIVDGADGCMSSLLNPRETALEAALRLSELLPGYNDVADYDNERAIFIKRAQLLVSDINYALVGAGKAGFSCMHELTGLADYKLPQLLRFKQVLTYDHALASSVDNLTPISAGSSEEVEIRAATIVAIELIRAALAEAKVLTTAAEIDARLWLMSQQLHSTKIKPYHRCLTAFY
jgi:hypothetical protein